MELAGNSKALEAGFPGFRFELSPGTASSRSSSVTNFRFLLTGSDPRETGCPGAAILAVALYTYLSRDPRHSPPRMAAESAVRPMASEVPRSCASASTVSREAGDESDDISASTTKR